MDKHVALFRFKLNSGQSVGPVALRALWSRACESNDVSVSRQASRFGGGTQTSYLLHGPANIADLRNVEQRLRTLINESKLVGTISPLH